MFKKISKYLFIGIFRFIYFLPVLAIVIFLTFLFGHKILGPYLVGSDNANFVTLADWLLKWFPKIPFWFPQEGGGMSITTSYPILNQLIVVVLQKLTNIPIVVVFRIWSLITVVLTSMGLYLLTFRLTKNQTIAAISAIFYPLMPITWIFLLMWGFAAEQLSLIFVPPVLIFAPLFLDEYYLNGLTKKAKIYFLIFLITVAILPIAHPMMFIGVLVFIFVLFIVYPIIVLRESKVKLKKLVILDLVVMVIIIFATLYWTIPFISYQSNVNKGAPVEAEIYNRNVYLQNGIYPISVFNISDESAGYIDYTTTPRNISGWAWRNVSFPFIISVLALIGLIGSFFLNRKVFAFGIANLVPLAIAVFPKIDFIFLKFPLSGFILNWRAGILMSRFIIPLLAGFGCYVLAYLFTFPLNLLSKWLKNSFLSFSLRSLFVLMSGVLSLVIAGVLLWNFKSWPFNNPNFLLSLGTEVVVPSERMDLRNIWRDGPGDPCYGGGVLPTKDNKFPLFCQNIPFQEHFLAGKLGEECSKFSVKDVEIPSDIVSLCSFNPDEETVLRIYKKCESKNTDLYYSDICQSKVKSIGEQLNFNNLKEILAKKNLLNNGTEMWGKEIDLFKLLPDNPNTRVDIGTSIGAFMMMEPFYSSVPELPVYYNTGTLMKTLWNYQIGIFNQKKTVWPQDSIMYELSKYFGLEYMFLSENLVPIDKYLRTGWERVHKLENEPLEGLALWRFNEPTSLLTVTTRPTVLVIGQDKVDGYFRTFHLANLGTISFNDAILVKGDSFVDNYTSEELKQFDVVILEGYAYKKQAKGWRVLDEYVKSGGSLLINNGWQFSSADWNIDKTPNFFPIGQLGWIDPGNVNNFSLIDNEIGSGINVDKFSPLVYGGTNWNISSGNLSSVRNWAKVILSNNEKPLIAGGQYGSGRVIWMGFDLPGHIGAYQDNVDEIKLYGNLIKYLLNNKTGQVLKAGFSRSYPDRLEITLNESSNQKTIIYWSEAFYPDFKAKLISQGKSERIKFYKAGPGMTLFSLPNVKSGSKIIYEYKTPIKITIAKGISIFTLIAIIMIIVYPQYLNIVITILSRLAVKAKFKKHIFGDDDESNY
ncbi:hypothetical protein A2422_00840 [Candidatus Woesebacteria bacterium RIFOXYC1_FULL_31_51]|uniref:Membrane protein 6-pyruvoyl-tetrahydropterin synthase-related domain-containing protein n=1 Tax=Candidatus Woesebacteria bacterium GW2011_GWC2_31_9 TaxID=1618586 RepID=A0A0F9YLS9_9BACT|nr:MAG: hypothetical protein UR17_C0001G0518 [Candidatus Woesebacteria bacterium GW2011_GWF1_31_35]KKP22865.1 MAG: hypothetical protein UR11_C0002G0245 [Candidatus Woesebacteria bacterium GW2011_GWC1_30_29]KKP26647.1 MAG: hypothetical protein UR13_C0003G0014 [Candidatus Woesebacteria bacterium GW2011_GWD1_31_12]KKP28113.1 MAG: hypothetical protein UR16_C0001G0134 [Candidatus Woesebacteria bacterium GW2011_GWB1_31_29]KKP32218.1 MAG: hypothetical protein UR21_C0001G0014 [Candidatus Woesebacteria 